MLNCLSKMSNILKVAGLQKELYKKELVFIYSLEVLT